MLLREEEERRRRTMLDTKRGRRWKWLHFRPPRFICPFLAPASPRRPRHGLSLAPSLPPSTVFLAGNPRPAHDGLTPRSSLALSSLHRAADARDPPPLVRGGPGADLNSAPVPPWKSSVPDRVGTLARSRSSNPHFAWLSTTPGAPPGSDTSQSAQGARRRTHSVTGFRISS